jgi:hypothetical protein
MPVGGMKRSTKLPVGESEVVAPIAFRSYHLLLETALRSSQMGPASPAYGEPDFSCSRPGKGKKRRQWEAF